MDPITDAELAELRTKIRLADVLPWHLVGKPWADDRFCDTYAVSGNPDPHVGKAVIQWAEVDEVTIGDGDTESSAWGDAEGRQRDNLACAVSAVNALPTLLDALEQAQRERDEARALLAAKWPEAGDLDEKLAEHDAWLRRQRIMRVAIAPVNVEGVGDLVREMRNIFAAGCEDARRAAARIDTLERERDEARKTANEEAAQFNAGYDSARDHAGTWPNDPREYEPGPTDMLLAGLGESDHDTWANGFAWGAYERMAARIATLEAALAEWGDACDDMRAASIPVRPLRTPESNLAVERRLKATDALKAESRRIRAALRGVEGK